MKNTTKLVLAASALAAVPLFVFAPGHTSKAQKASFMGRNYAHRGLHSIDKVIPENSLEAFRLASETGYGIELDVQLSKDGQVVVFHDDTLSRVCGVDSRVDNKTFEQLQQLRLCGTEHTIPLFSDVLDTVAGRSVLIVELKSGKRNRELCQKTYELLSSYKGEFCIESFDPRIVAWFRRNAPEIVRGQLATSADEYKNYPKVLGAILSHCGMNFLTRPQFIAYRIGKRPLSVRLSEALGAMKVCWTSHEPRNEKGMDAVIFEFYKPGVKFNK